MVRVNCQNGDGGGPVDLSGSWVGDLQLQNRWRSRLAIKIAGTCALRFCMVRSGDLAISDFPGLLTAEMQPLRNHFEVSTSSQGALKGQTQGEKPSRKQIRAIFQRGKLFYLQLELLGLQLSFFACSPLKPLLDALSHCKQKSSNCK